MAYVYILVSEKNKRYYIGSTENLDKRIKEHNFGKVISTKGWRPLKLAFKQEYDNISAAQKVELHLKKLKRKDYIETIIREGFIKIRKD
ncbi:MAG: GIY-YIG nuclease family protein [Candidatus Omnitrophota bacterium]